MQWGAGKLHYSFLYNGTVILQHKHWSQLGAKNSGHNTRFLAPVQAQIFESVLP